VAVNAFGSQILERKRAENARELNQEKLELKEKAELSSVLAR